MTHPPDDPGAFDAANPSREDAEHFTTTAVADAAIDEARRRRSLRRQADESDTLAGVLVSLGERGVAVTVEAADTRRVIGTVVLVGDDVVGLRTATGNQVLIALTAVGSIRVTPEAGATQATGDRAVAGGSNLSACARRLAELRARVSIRAGGTGPVAGTVQSCGHDVLVLAAEGDAGQVLVPLANITEIGIDDRVM